MHFDQHDDMDAAPSGGRHGSLRRQQRFPLLRATLSRGASRAPGAALPTELQPQTAQAEAGASCWVPTCPTKTAGADEDVVDEAFLRLRCPPPRCASCMSEAHPGGQRGGSPSAASPAPWPRHAPPGRRWIAVHAEPNHFTERRVLRCSDRHMARFRASFIDIAS